MRADRATRSVFWLILVTVCAATGCTPRVDDTDNGNGNANGNGNGNGNDGGTLVGGFQDNGLPAPESLPVGVENTAPTGDAKFPPVGSTVPRGDVVFLWEASDANGTNLDSTIYLDTDSDVFTSPVVTFGMRTSPDEVEHRLTLQMPDAGVFYWAVEITDGVTTIRRPATGVGLMFEVSETATGRIGAEDVVLLCPRETPTAREVTTFSWSLGQTVPTRAQVFVSRAGLDNPFETPLAIFDVPAATATSRALTAEEALPTGDLLSWGLRLETAGEVLFTFEGQTGTVFQVAENVAPSGELLAPDNDTVWADDTTDFTLSWTADAGNCEDPLATTLYFELLAGLDEPAALFDSAIHLALEDGVFDATTAGALADLDLQSGRWAWGVVADDATDQATLPDGLNPARTFRTFIRDTAPRFIADPVVTPEICGTGQSAHDSLAFSYTDDNGLDTVAVTLSFSTAQADVFDNAASTLSLPAGVTGDVAVFLQTLGTTECEQFVEGAGFYGVTLDDGVNAAVRATVEYAGPPPGACCASDGSCTEGPADACIAGTYEGDGTTCAAANCPQPPQIADCNSNGIADDQDIALETSIDCNLNGVPDECESSPIVVDAGTLAPGSIDLQSTYDSTPNGNDLIGSICPTQGQAQVLWTLESSPPGSEVSIRTPDSLSSAYFVNPAIVGDYVFRLTLVGTQLSDVVTLTIQ